MMKKQNEASISELLKRISNNPKYAPKLTKVKLENAWIEIMGATVNRYTTQLSIRKSTVTVKISSSALRQDLFMNREKILKKIIRYLGDDSLTEIQIR